MISKYAVGVDCFVVEMDVPTIVVWFGVACLIDCVNNMSHTYRPLLRIEQACHCIVNTRLENKNLER